MANLLLLLGVIFLIAGLLVKIFPGVKLPLLPGDIYLHRENFSFYFPIVTSVIISIVLTIIINFFR